MTKQEAILISAYTGYNLFPDFEEIKMFIYNKTGMTITEEHYTNPGCKEFIQLSLKRDVENLVENLTE